MGSILLFGWNLIIHIMSSLQRAQSFPCIRQLWHSVYCHCRQCLMVSLLFFNLCCEEGLSLLHLVWSSVTIDWPLTSIVWLSERRRGSRTPRSHLARPGCSSAAATETETTCSGKLCFCFSVQSPNIHTFSYTIILSLTFHYCSLDPHPFSPCHCIFCIRNVGVLFLIPYVRIMDTIDQSAQGCIARCM